MFHLNHPPFFQQFTITIYYKSMNMSICMKRLQENGLLAIYYSTDFKDSIISTFLNLKYVTNCIIKAKTKVKTLA